MAELYRPATECGGESEGVVRCTNQTYSRIQASIDMNVLHVITRYNRIKADPDAKWVPRVNIFGGKAASAYYMAKHIIHLINDVAKVINNDSQIGDKLKVVFIPNYSVSLAQLIIPAADLSEQISLAGTEASGTSNMKFALNGARTIGTLDGANVEMLDHVPVLTISLSLVTLRKKWRSCVVSGYKPREYYEKDEELHQVLTRKSAAVYSVRKIRVRYRDLVDSLINFGDHYRVLADYRSYVDCQDRSRRTVSRASGRVDRKSDAEHCQYGLLLF
ncbi:glycogen/starch/alpha-glucan phosphorylase [Escherichia coli]|nr:glycogen/starch/alpha-glucan phosphorylase [Escherichia coli]